MPETYTPAIYRRFSTPLSLNLGSTTAVIEATNKIVETVKTNTDQLPDIAKAVNNSREAVENAVSAGKKELLLGIGDVYEKTAKAVEQATAKILSEVKTNTSQLPDIEKAVNNSRDAVVGAVDAGKNDLRQGIDDVSGKTAKAVEEATTKILSEVKTLVETTVGNAKEAIIDAIHEDPVDEDFEIKGEAKPFVQLLVLAQVLAVQAHSFNGLSKGGKNFNMGVLRELAKAQVQELGDANSELCHRFLTAFENFKDDSLPYRSDRFLEMHHLIRDIAQHFQGD